MADSGSPKRMTEQEYIDAIIRCLYQAEEPSLNIKQIAERIGVNQNTIPKYLNLIVDKFIKLQISGPTKLYYLTVEGQEKGRQLFAQK